jgi:hypothetical protein
MGCILRHFYMGECIKKHIDRINEQVVTPYTVLPEDICYATYFNQDHDAQSMLHCSRSTANTCMRLAAGDTSDLLMIFSDNIMAENGSKMYVPFKNCTMFWENCGEMMQ